MKVINLLGGPGIGKSTTACGLFHLMKIKEFKVELVREYVKDSVYENRDIFDDQVYIFAKQNRRQHILKNKVDWIITDSPLILNAVYAPENYLPSFGAMALEGFNQYTNYNFLLTREKDYVTMGRLHSEFEAMEIDERIREYMKENDIDYNLISGGDFAHQEIYNWIFSNG